MVLAFFLTSVMLFAQGPEQNSADGELEELAQDGTGAAPIDDYVMVLALLGSAFVFFTMKACAKQGNTLEK
jgi:hypothetical protein